MKKNTFIISIYLFSLNILAAGLISGPKGGTYHQMGEDLVKMVKELNLNNKTSSGSLENLNDLVDNFKTHFAIVQHDVLLYEEMKGNKDLRKKVKLVYPLHKEEFHILVKANSKFKSIHDLKNMNVNVGGKKSGTAYSTNVIKSTLNLNWKDYHYEPKEAIKKLLTNDIDAAVLMIGKPYITLELIPPSARKVLRLLPLKDERLLSLYEPTIIRENTYPWQNKRVYTHATRAALVTLDYKEKVIQKGITKFVNSINRNLPTLRKTGHKKWKDVEPDTLIRWPKHPNAIINSAEKEILKNLK